MSDRFGMQIMGDLLCAIAAELGCDPDGDEILITATRLTRERDEARRERDEARAVLRWLEYLVTELVEDGLIGDFDFSKPCEEDPLCSSQICASGGCLVMKVRAARAALPDLPTAENAR